MLPQRRLLYTFALPEEHGTETADDARLNHERSCRTTNTVANKDGAYVRHAAAVDSIVYVRINSRRGRRSLPPATSPGCPWAAGAALRPLPRRAEFSSLSDRPSHLFGHEPDDPRTKLRLGLPRPRRRPALQTSGSATRSYERRRLIPDPTGPASIRGDRPAGGRPSRRRPSSTRRPGSSCRTSRWTSSSC